jgi:hypothetical protein
MIEAFYDEELLPRIGVGKFLDLAFGRLSLGVHHCDHRVAVA